MNVLQLFPIEDAAQTTKIAPTTGPDIAGQSRLSANKATQQNFATFWTAYPRKCAKQDAIKAWVKLKPNQQVAAIAAMPDHLKFWQQHATAKIHMPHPATWLNGMRWEDELFPAQEAKAAGSVAGEPWFNSFSGMERKASELGLKVLPGENGHSLKARIIAAQDRADQVSASQIRKAI